MTDYTELKRLVEAGSLPPIVSTLIAENERIDGCCKAMALDMGKLTRERNSFRSSAEKLKAENERLAAACERAEQIIIVECKAASLAKVRANLLEANRDQLRAEVAGLKTGYEAYERVNAELKAENERLNDEYDKAWRHDLNGKKNVQVLAAEVARLSAENEALRKDADRAAYWKQRAKSAEGHLFSGDFRAAAMELHKYSRFESTPWPELTGSQHALITSAAGAVIATVNRLRDARRPKNRDETDAIIWCACGDGYAANSYGAGFMDANGGVCANCDAAVGCGRSNSRGSEQDQIPTETPVPERSACRSENP